MALQRASLPSSALHALGEHAAVLGVEMHGVSDWHVVGGAVGRRWTHSVTMWWMGTTKEWPEASSTR